MKRALLAAAILAMTGVSTPAGACRIEPKPQDVIGSQYDAIVVVTVVETLETHEMRGPAWRASGRLKAIVEGDLADTVIAFDSGTSTCDLGDLHRRVSPKVGEEWVLYLTLGGDYYKPGELDATRAYRLDLMRGIDPRLKAPTRPAPR